MVRNVRFDAIDGVTRPVIALCNDYPDGHWIPPHRHRHGQLICGVTGAIVVATPQGTLHDVRMLGEARLHLLYLAPEAADGMPLHCQVVGMSPFIRSLMSEAMELPAEYDREGRAGALMNLLLHEMRQLPVLPLSLPFPEHPALARRCRQFLEAPTPHQTIADWSAALGLSRRAFTRLFRQQTGLSFVSWRQQACLIAALPRLVAGTSVTEIALDLGYDNPAAFTAMFKRIQGASPRSYLRQNG